MCFCVLPLLCYAVLRVSSSFAIIWLRKRQSFAFLKLSRGYYWPVSSPIGAVVWSAMFDFGVSWSYSLHFLSVHMILLTNRVFFFIHGKVLQVCHVILKA